MITPKRPVFQELPNISILLTHANKRTVERQVLPFFSFCHFVKRQVCPWAVRYGKNGSGRLDTRRDVPDLQIYRREAGFRRVCKKERDPFTLLCARGPSSLCPLEGPLSVAFAFRRVQKVVHHPGRGRCCALDGVGVDFGGGGRVCMTQVARYRCQRNTVGNL